MFQQSSCNAGRWLAAEITWSGKLPLISRGSHVTDTWTAQCRDHQLTNRYLGIRGNIEYHMGVCEMNTCSLEHQGGPGDHWTGSSQAQSGKFYISETYLAPLGEEPGEPAVLKYQTGNGNRNSRPTRQFSSLQREACSFEPGLKATLCEVDIKC
jgi:hypothetical protein